MAISNPVTVTTVTGNIASLPAETSSSALVTVPSGKVYKLVRLSGTVGGSIEPSNEFVLEINGVQLSDRWFPSNATSGTEEWSLEPLTLAFGASVHGLAHYDGMVYLAAGDVVRLYNQTTSGRSDIDYYFAFLVMDA